MWKVCVCVCVRAVKAIVLACYCTPFNRAASAAAAAVSMLNKKC